MKLLIKLKVTSLIALNVNNYTKVFAGDLDDGSFDNCSSHVWFKVIRMTDLLGTNDGSDAINLLSCNGLNGDANSTVQGNQVYFDDDVKFCCADVGQRIMVVLRVFDVYMYLNDCKAFEIYCSCTSTRAFLFRQ